MNPYSFEAVFSGACGFVPNKPLVDLDNPPTRMRVLLPEGTSGVKSQRVSPHYPFLKIPLKNLASSAGLSPSLTFKSGDEVWYVIFLVADWDIEFSFGATGYPQKLKIVNGEPLDPENPTGNERYYFFFLASLEEVAPSVSFVDPSCVQDNIDGERVSARFTLTSGEIKVKGLTTLGGEYVVWEFKPEDGEGTIPERKVLANAVSVSKQGLTEVTLLKGSRTVDGQKEEFEVSLRPPDGENDISIEIGNSEWERIIDIPGGEEEDPDELNENGQYVARDLKVVYRLSQQVDPSLPIPKYLPLPHAIPPGGAGRPVHCPFALYAAHPKA
jgi:hypothetical protein